MAAIFFHPQCVEWEVNFYSSRILVVGAVQLIVYKTWAQHFMFQEQPFNQQDTTL